MEARSALDRVFLVAYLSHLGSISLYSVLFFIFFVFLHAIKKTPKNRIIKRFMGVFFGAARRIRTADLVLTKDALCRLSHSSIRGRGRRT